MAEEGEVTSSSEEEIEEELLEVRKRQGGGLAAEDKRNESAGEEETGTEGGSDTEGEGDRISDEKLKGLRFSESLCEMLGNRHLRELLVEIDQATNPQQALQRAMNIPVFVEFADECLRMCGLREAEEGRT